MSIIEEQVRVLSAQRCDEIFQEQVSSVRERDKLDRALEYVRKAIYLSSPSLIA